VTPPAHPSRPRRALLTTDTIGGVWIHTMELASALHDEGIEVTVATLGDEPSRRHLDEAQRRGVALHSRRCRLPWMPDPWDDLEGAGRWLVELARETEADIVHLGEPVFATQDWPAPTVAVAHSCVLSWWESVLGEPAPRAWSRYRDAMRAGLAAADAVIAPSDAMLGSLRRHYGVRGGRAIPNGRDPAGLRPGIKDGFVLTAGRLWDPAKNAKALDSAAAGLAWPVHAAGEREAPDGGESASFIHLRPLGTLDQPQLGAWMSRAGIFALPAKYEPFGLSVLEAALAGCALVLGDIPSLRENWDGVAVFVPPDDAALLRMALTSLIDDAGLRHSLAMRAHRRAQGYSARRMALAYLDVYGGVLAGREAPACAS
jgi:glycogen(starch) synthase